MSVEPVDPGSALTQRAVELDDLTERLTDAQAELAKMDAEHAAATAPLQAQVEQLAAAVDQTRVALAIAAGIRPSHGLRTPLQVELRAPRLFPGASS